MKRAVPQAEHTEQSVIGALMLEPSLVDEVVGLRPELFFTPANRLIFETIAQIRKDGGVPNFVAVTQLVQAAGKLEFVGGAGAVAELVSKSAGGANAVEYAAGVLRDMHARREIIAQAARMQSAASDMAMSADDALQKAGEAVLSLSLGQDSDSMRPAGAIVPGLMQELEALASGAEKLGIKTGFMDVDQVTGGLRAGQLVVVAGRPAMGKSALMLNMAENMSRRGVPVVYFSLEMQANELASRVVLSRAETNTEVIRNGFLDHKTKLRISERADEFAKEPLYVDDRGGLSLMDIRGRARLAVRRWGVKCIFVDYLQLVTHAGTNSRENEVGFVSRGLKAMAMELGVPVVAAAQVNRMAENRSDNRPKLSDLRESGSIEQDADLVMLVHRPAYYAVDAAEPDPQEAELIIAKHRAGRSGKIDLMWSPSMTRFSGQKLHGRTQDTSDECFAPDRALWEAINE